MQKGGYFRMSSENISSSHEKRGHVLQNEGVGYGGHT